MAEGQRIDALTSLRFFAASAIVLHHMPGNLIVPAGAFDGWHLKFGVSFFFVLSGFILQHAYRNRILEIGFLRFVALRFARLWPCHIAALMLLLVFGGPPLINFYSNYPQGDILAVVALFQAWSPEIRVAYALNGPSWSISVELFFYALFPFMCRAATVNRYYPLLTGLVLTLAYVGYVTIVRPAGDMEAMLYVNPLARLLEFCAGITAYEFINARKQRFGTLHEIAALSAIFISLSVMPASIVTNTSLNVWLQTVFAMPAFVLTVVIFSREGGAISRTLTAKPLVFLGDISFALYLVHLPALIYFKVRAETFAQYPQPLVLIQFVLMLLIISALLHRMVEKPILRKVTNLLFPRRAVTQAA